MITIQGTLRQRGKIKFKEEPERLKLWVEHESPRDNGTSDLRIEELFLPMECAEKLPKDGSPIAINVRVYADGKHVKFSALGLAGKIHQAVA